MAPVPEHGLHEVALLRRELARAAREQQVGEADHRVERGPELVRHVGQELALEPGRPLEFQVLGRERELVAAQLLEGAGPLEAHHGLVAQGAEELEVVRVERPAVPPVVHADGADGEPGRAERHDGGGLEAEPQLRARGEARVAFHVVREERLVVVHHPARERALGRKQLAPRHGHDPRGRHDPEEAALLHQQGDDRPLRLEQVLGGGGDHLEERLGLRALEQRGRDLTQPLELPVPPRRRVQG